jgi:hypothetical protein
MKAGYTEPGSHVKKFTHYPGALETVGSLRAVQLYEKTCMLKRSDCGMEKGSDWHCPSDIAREPPGKVNFSRCPAKRVEKWVKLIYYWFFF